MISRLEMVED